MGTREETQLERRETILGYQEHKRRVVASGGNARQFDGLRLAAAAARRTDRTLDALGRARGAVERPATEEEVRLTLQNLADEAAVASSTGSLHVFRNELWPTADGRAEIDPGDFA